MIDRRAASAVLGAALLALCAVPGEALAHGLHADPNRSLGSYLPLGIEHMMLGWDHLLFIVGVVLLGRTLRNAVKLISLFVLGHSLTLLVATLAGWQVDATAVDVVIALSVAFVGVCLLRGVGPDWRWLGLSVFGFGLIHGLGLSTRLQALGLPDDGMVERVVLFNIGLEIGQVIVIGLVFGVIAALRKGRPIPEGALRLASVVIAVVGASSALFIALSNLAPEKERLSSACVESPTAPAKSRGVNQGSHPKRQFYMPGEEVPEEDLDHVTLDGYVIVRYAPDLPAADRRRLRGALGGVRMPVVAAPATDNESAMLLATTTERKLTCSALNLDDFSLFRDSWFEDRYGYVPE